MKKSTLIRAGIDHVPPAKGQDIIDAALIAACTAAVETLHAPPDPRFAALAEHLTFIEQIEEDIARGAAKDSNGRTQGRDRSRESRASKNAARSSSNAFSPFRAPMPVSPSGSIF